MEPVGEEGEPLAAAEPLDGITEGVVALEPPSTWAAIRQLATTHRHKLVLGAAVWVWWLTFYKLGALRHDRYSTFGFDLGIFDQAAWLVSRFRVPFMTVRGLDVFGHHGNFVFYLFAPFYWLGAGPKFLLFAQLTSQGAGVVGIYLLARDRLDNNRWLAVLLAGSMLLHPSMQFQAWEFFHPEAFAIGPIILAYWAARVGRWRLFWAMAVLAMSCKEDVTLVFAVLGILLMFRKEMRVGAWLTGIAIAWYVAVTKLLIPWRNPAGPFYEQQFFRDYGGSLTSVLRTILRHPTKLWRSLNEKHRIDFYAKMWAPVAFVPFLSPQTLAMTLPMLLVIVLAGVEWVQDYHYHYTAIPIAITFIATVEAIASLRNQQRRSMFVGAVFACSVFATAVWGASPLSRNWETGYWPHRHEEGYLEILVGRQFAASTWPKVGVEQEAVAMIPSGASVSASYNVVPHLTHRPLVYQWPNPWIPDNWGTCNDNSDDPAIVDWIVVDRGLFGNDTSQRALLENLLAGEFAVRVDRDDVVVAERVALPARTTPPPVVSCNGRIPDPGS